MIQCHNLHSENANPANVKVSAAGLPHKAIGGSGPSKAGEYDESGESWVTQVTRYSKRWFPV
jgi:hypothetical protein